MANGDAGLDVLFFMVDCSVLFCAEETLGVEIEEAGAGEREQIEREGAGEGSSGTARSERVEESCREVGERQVLPAEVSQAPQHLTEAVVGVPSSSTRSLVAPPSTSPKSNEWCYALSLQSYTLQPNAPGLHIEPQPPHALEMTLDDALALERAVPILIHVGPIEEETVVARFLRLGARAASGSSEEKSQRPKAR